MQAPSFDPRDLRKAFGQFATGVTVVTTALADGRRFGVTVNSFASVSLTPALVSWNYRRDAPGLPLLMASDYFAVHVLGQAQEAVSRQFSAPLADRFAGVATQPGLGGVPLIEDCAATFECRQWSTVDAGDHVIFLGQVMRYQHRAAQPLVFHGGSYVGVAGAAAP